MDTLDIGVADALRNCRFIHRKIFPFLFPSPSVNPDFNHIRARKSGQQRQAFRVSGMRGAGSDSRWRQSSATSQGRHPINRATPENSEMM